MVKVSCSKAEHHHSFCLMNIKRHIYDCKAEKQFEIRTIRRSELFVQDNDQKVNT